MKEQWKEECILLIFLSLIKQTSMWFGPLFCINECFGAKWNLFSGEKRNLEIAKRIFLKISWISTSPADNLHIKYSHCWTAIPYMLRVEILHFSDVVRAFINPIFPKVAGKTEILSLWCNIFQQNFLFSSPDKYSLPLFWRNTARNTFDEEDAFRASNVQCNVFLHIYRRQISLLLTVISQIVGKLWEGNIVFKYPFLCIYVSVSLLRISLKLYWSTNFSNKYYILWILIFSGFSVKHNNAVIPPS